MIWEQLSQEERLTKLEYTRELKNLMGIYSGLYLLKREGEIYQQLWSARPDVSLGINEGFYTCAETVSGYYRALQKDTAHKSAYLKAQFPQAAAGLSAPEAQGFGLIDYRPMDTFVIEIAGDNQTAKGLWYCRGSYVDMTEQGPVSRWLWGYYAVDFILEDGQWKIWHMLDLKDADNFCGTKWMDREIDLPSIDAFSGAGASAIPAPDRPCVLQERYHNMRKWTPAPRLPEPYDTFAETFSYGTEWTVKDRVG